MSIRPTVTFAMDDWFVNLEDEKLVMVKDKMEEIPFAKLDRERLQELYVALIDREDELQDLLACVCSMIDGLDYVERKEDNGTQDTSNPLNW